MGIGISTFTEAVGAGPQALRHHGHQDVRQRRDPRPSDRLGDPARRNEVAGARTRDDLAQIAAEELGLDPQNIMVEEATPTGTLRLGTYASRSTPVAGAAIAMASRKIREKARKIAAHLLEAAVDDVEWTNYKFR